MAGSFLAYRLYRLAWTALDWVFPPVCGGCNTLGSRWCSTCQKNVPILCGNVCDSCGTPQDKAGLCLACELVHPPYLSLRSWAVFDDPVRQALHGLKYRRNVGLGDSLAAQMADFLRALAWPIDFIAPIPLSDARRRERGYNQVGMIAQPLALALGMTYAPKALARSRNTRSQVGLSKEQRRENVRDAFQADRAQVGGRVVLLMDDVATTGSTLSSGAEALLSAGASQVYAFTVARALTRHGLSHA